jgi:hypothetical protein
MEMAAQLSIPLEIENNSPRQRKTSSDEALGRWGTARQVAA